MILKWLLYCSKNQTTNTHLNKVDVTCDCLLNMHLRISRKIIKFISIRSIHFCFVKHESPGGMKVHTALFCIKVTVKVAMSLTLVTFERIYTNIQKLWPW